MVALLTIQQQQQRDVLVAMRLLRWRMRLLRRSLSSGGGITYFGRDGQYFAIGTLVGRVAEL